MQAGESFDEAFRARLAKAPLHRRLAFTDGGLTLGAGAVVAKMATDARGRSVGLALAGEEESILVPFAAAFGKAVSPHVLSNLSRASEHWSRGDKCLAHIHLAHAGLPEIDAAGAYRLALCEQALALGYTPRAIYKALDLEPPPPFGKFSADQPRVPAGSGSESGRWTSSAGGAAAVQEGRSVSPATSQGGARAGAAEPSKPGEPVPVVLNNGTVAKDPITGKPIVQPAGVSLAQNVKIGEALSLLPTKFLRHLGIQPVKQRWRRCSFLVGRWTTSVFLASTARSITILSGLEIITMGPSPRRQDTRGNKRFLAQGSRICWVAEKRMVQCSTILRIYLLLTQDMMTIKQA